MIVINGKFLSQQITGVQRYGLNISKYLPTEINQQKVTIAAPKGTSIPKELSHLAVIKFGNFKGNAWEQIDLPLFLKKNNNPLLINFTGVSPLLYSNTFLYIHDLSYKHYPEWFSKPFAMYYNFALPINAKKAKKILTVSHYVKNDLVETYNLPESKVNVIYCAADEKFKNLNLPREKFVLLVSSLDPRKNIKNAIKSFLKIKSDYTLKVVGKKHPSFADIGINNDDLSHQIEFTGYVSDKELNELYNKATLFFYPSIFEGFGIPPLEAQKCHCPALVSNTTCLPEIYENSVQYCDPYNVNNMSENLNKLLHDDQQQKKLVQLGLKNEKRFSWEKSAQKLTDLIKSYLDK